MNKAFLAVGVSFLVIGIVSSTVAGGIVWSTFVTLGVVFLALAFAFRDPGGERAAGEADATESAGSTVDEDV